MKLLSNFKPAAAWMPAAAAIFLGACAAGGGGPPANPPVPVETAHVITGPVEDRLSAVGTILPNEAVDLMPEVAGRIAGIHFQEGQRVKAGTLLFELDAEKESAQLAQAMADLELARQNALRAEKLSDTKAISRQEIDQVKSQVALKEAVQAFQAERVEAMKLVTPFDGVLGPRKVSVGQFVNLGQTLVTLTDDSKVKVVYRLPERHLAELRTGQEVFIRVSAYGEKSFPGQVDLINPQVDAATRTIEVRAVAPNPDGLLKPGMFARVETVIGKRPNALLIPEKALVPSLTGFSVYTVSSNTARLVPIDLGTRLPGQVEVRKGLSVGQEIVVGGLQKIIDGSPVQPAKSEPETSAGG